MTKYEIKNTTQFKKDYKLAKRRGLNLELLKTVIKKLANGETLEAKYKDHPLSGDWIGYRGIRSADSPDQKETFLKITDSNCSSDWYLRIPL